MRRSTPGRRALAAGLCTSALASVLVAGPGGPASAQAPASGLVQEQPRSADEFVDSVGVVTHFRYVDTTYARSEELIDALQRLGVRHVRDGLPLRPSPELLATLRSLREHGIGLNVVLGTANLPRGNPLPPAAEPVATLGASGLEGVVESIEAPNEWDLRGGDTWVSDLQTFQRELYEGVRSDPRWDGVPVLGPSVGRYTRIGQLRGVAEHMDVANLHNYPRGGPPEELLEQELADARAVAPGKPLFITETGYHTAINQDRPSPSVPEEAKGDYLPRTLLENFRAGVARTFIYQLVDEQPEPALEEQEQHFGLLRADLSETPAYQAVRDLLTGLADPGPAFPTTPLAVQVDGSPDVQHLLLQKRDGSYQMVLWRRGLLHDGDDDVSGSAPVSVTFAEPRALELRAGATERALGQASTVEGVLADRPLVLDIGTPAAAAGAAAAVAFDDTVPAAQDGAPAPAPDRQAPADPTGPAGTDDDLPVLLLGVLLGAALVGGGTAIVLLRRRRTPSSGPLPPVRDEDDRLSQSGHPHR